MSVKKVMGGVKTGFDEGAFSVDYDGEEKNQLLFLFLHLLLSADAESDAISLP